MQKGSHFFSSSLISITCFSLNPNFLSWTHYWQTILRVISIIALYKIYSSNGKLSCSCSVLNVLYRYTDVWYGQFPLRNNMPKTTPDMLYSESEGTFLCLYSTYAAKSYQCVWEYGMRVQGGNVTTSNIILGINSKVKTSKFLPY